MIQTGTWRDHCTLCGIRFEGGCRRFQDWSSLLAFLRRRCKPTPFVHGFLTGMRCEQGGARGVCIPCINWKRRVDGAGLRRAKTPMLQLDQLVLYMMQPGKHPEPDRRCMDRLIRAMRQDDNPFQHALPLPAQTIVRGIQGNTYLHVVASWWEYNGKTDFFSSSEEVRRVRCAIKQGLVSEEIIVC